MIESRNNLRTDTTLIEIVEMHPYEIQLIKQIRSSLKFGKIEIFVRNGLPYRLERITESVDLTGLPKGNLQDK